VSFLAGIQTGTDDKTGCTANNKIRNFKMFLLNFSFDKKIKIINKAKIYNKMFVI
jgi:hypothetical protein